jgi:integrase/recombinase XerD
MIGPEGVRLTGPLTPYAEGFWTHLVNEAYSSVGRGTHLRLLAHLSRWMADAGLEIADLKPRVVERFLRRRRREGYATKVSPKSLTPLLSYLEGLDVLPARDDAPPSQTETLLQDYREYLRRERGLVAGSVRLYAGVARLFLSERAEPLAENISRLSGADVSTFIRHEAGRCGVAGAKTAVCGMRSLLRYLYAEGWTPRQLAAAVPAVAGRRLVSLPRAPEPGQVALMLESCDRDTVVGRRDFAILTVLARLGLRAEEVAALELDDIDWRAGEVVIRGKGPRLERLPLPSDVGEAVADHLRRGGSRGSCRQLFLRSAAPLRGISRGAVTSVVYRACERAGVPRVGAHRLRHNVCTQLLRQGASLPEVAQVLRHKSLLTTAIYAKVDRVKLSTLALPWPGGIA